MSSNILEPFLHKEMDHIIKAALKENLWKHL